MILLDANLLLYAAVEELGPHEVARSWLDQRLNGTVRVAFPWPTVLAFVRIASNPRVFERPASVAEAWHCVTEWLACAPAWIPEATERHREVLDGFLRTVVTSSKLVPDAHLAALAIAHGLTLCSTDGDFARFPGLTFENPLSRRPRYQQPERGLPSLAAREQCRERVLNERRSGAPAARLDGLVVVTVAPMRSEWVVAVLLAAAVTASGGEARAEKPGSREPRRAAGWMIIGLGGGLGLGSAVSGGVLLGGGRSSEENVGAATLAGGAATVIVSLLVGVPLVLLSEPEKAKREKSMAFARALSGQISW